MILLDLQKAFYIVDHEILCRKMKTMGFGSTDWFMSYLQNGRQIVTVGKTQSDPASVTCGVPQGSMLGRLLSLCYVNDMVISRDSDFLIVNFCFMQMIVLTSPIKIQMFG